MVLKIVVKIDVSVEPSVVKPAGIAQIYRN